MSNTITLKKSGVSGNAPSSSDLSLGEIALNYADGHLYYKSGASATPAKLNAGDADTLDGLHASSFVKTSGDSVISGSLVVDDGPASHDALPKGCHEAHAREHEEVYGPGYHE